MIKIDKYGGAEINENYISNDEILGIFRIQKALFEEEKIIASFEECENLWNRYSNDLSASWLYVSDNSKDIISQVKTSDFFTSIEDYLIKK